VEEHRDGLRPQTSLETGDELVVEGLFAQDLRRAGQDEAHRATIVGG